MAIAYDTGVNSSIAVSTSHTYSHTCTGTDRILFVASWTRGAICTGVTYGGVALTSTGTRVYEAGGDDYFELWYLINPASGANNVVFSRSASGVVGGSSVSYSGAKQSGQPDAYYGAFQSAGTTHTGTVTTVADNCWAVMLCRARDTGVSTAGSGTTRRTNTNGHIQLFDGNSPKTPAGSYSLNASTSSEPAVIIMASFAPSTGGSPTFIPRISFIM